MGLEIIKLGKSSCFMPSYSLTNSSFWCYEHCRMKIPRMKIPRMKIPRMKIPRIKIPRIKIPRMKITIIEYSQNWIFPEWRFPELNISRILNKIEKLPEIENWQ